MHEIIENGLEDYLSGNASGNFEAHLSSCADCRNEVLQFSALSESLAVFRDPLPLEETVQPTGSFYARLSQTIDARKAAASPWSIFNFNAAFGRRLAFGSLMTLALLGGFLVSRESDFAASESSSAEAILAAHDGTVPHEFGSDRDHMMATLTSYER